MEFTVSRAHELLVSSGRSVQVVGPDELVVDGRHFRVRLRRQPTPSDLRRERERLDRDRRELELAYVVPRISPALASTAYDLHGVMLVAIDELVVLAGGEARRTADDFAASPVAITARRPWGRFAVMRTLIQHRGRQRQVDLATAAGISQAAVSKALRALGPVAEEVRAGSKGAAEALWADFLEHYPGPQGVTTSWYSLDPPARQAAIVQAAHTEVLISGDVGADAIAPWRVVQRAALYAPTGVDLAALGFAEADSADSTLTVTVPADPTLFATARAWRLAQPTGLSTADPAIVAWDVNLNGGVDAAEAIDKLKAQVFATWP